MSVAELERRHRIVLPERHREALEDPTDPIHEACDFLRARSDNELLDFTRMNELLHSKDSSRWPDFLIAFASNGCGDYFAYDVREDAYRVVYIDPELPVWESLRGDDVLEYRDFEEWCESRMDL